MQQTFEEAVLKVVMWWMEKSFHTPLNQDNGDNSQQGGFIYALKNKMSMDIQDSITKDQEKKFEEKLTELLWKQTHIGGSLTLDVDYHPCRILFDACTHAGINCECLPIKSHTTIDRNNRVFAKHKYGSPTIEI